MPLNHREQGRGEGAAESGPTQCPPDSHLGSDCVLRLHGVWQKRTLFEEGARSPLIIRQPGARGNGQACPRVVEFVDL